MTEKEKVEIDMNRACDILVKICDDIKSDYLYDEVARLRHMAWSVINYRLEWEGKHE